MCRFSASLAPPPASEGPQEDDLSVLLTDDDFNWFNAIECMPDNELEQLEAPDGAQASSGDGSASNASPNDVSPSGYSDTSSYDLVELFKQQVQEQQQAAGFAMYAPQPQEQQILAPPAAFAVPDLKPQALSGAPQYPAAASFASASMGTCCPPAVVPPAPTSFTSTPSAAFNMAPKLPVSSSGSVVRKPGSKAQRTQAELDAAVERIKQKRRESAQRSRARKNEYMRQLEIENQGLKDEVQRLQAMLAAMQRGACMQHPQLSPVMGA